MILDRSHVSEALAQFKARTSVCVVMQIIEGDGVQGLSNEFHYALTKEDDGYVCYVHCMTDGLSFAFVESQTDIKTAYECMVRQHFHDFLAVYNDDESETVVQIRNRNNKPA